MGQFEFLLPSQSDHPYTVTEINDGIATILESVNTLVWVEGEISNWKPTSSGHCYFRLKDQDCQVPAVLWKTNAAQLTFKPQDGMAVLAIASIRVYQKGGYYQLDIHRLQPLGSGALYIAFEKLKSKLEREGLFDQSFKKPLPQSITKIGVITSKQGAAIRDIARVVLSRAPQTDIILIDVAVQGEKAASQIANAIKCMNQYGKVDCIIVGRGGGSIEDLWAFNEEIVARAIFDSTIPVISAVGHEIDFTIADFVADVRAATPSAAAEMAVPDSKENSRYLDSCGQRFCMASQIYFDSIENEYRRTVAKSEFRLPIRLLMERSQQLDESEILCKKNLRRVFEKAIGNFKNAGVRLNAMSPLAILSRGYVSVVDENANAVKSSGQLSVGSRVKMQFYDGNAFADITAVNHSQLSSAS